MCVSSGYTMCKHLVNICTHIAYIRKAVYNHSVNQSRNHSNRHKIFVKSLEGLFESSYTFDDSYSNLHSNHVQSTQSSTYNSA